MNKKPEVTFEETKEQADLFWLADDSECGLEDFESALEDCGEDAVVEVLTAKSMKTVFAAFVVTEIDEDGDPAVWEAEMFETREEAEQSWQSSWDALIAKAKENATSMGESE